MRQPLAWAGATVVLGAALWPWVRPAPGGLLLGVVLLGAVAVLGGRWRVAGAAVPAAGLLLGLLSAAHRPAPPVVRGPVRVVGSVVGGGGTMVDLDTDIGALRVGGVGPGVGVGARIAAWVEPGRPRDRLPGAADPARGADRARRAVVRARQWVPLGPGATRVPAPFDGLEHGGLLRALATGDRRAVRPSTVSLLTRTGTRHLLAVSGLHVGLVAGVAAALARLVVGPLALLRWPWLVRAVPGAAALVAALAYGARVGWPVSTRRAVVMVAIAAVAVAAGRTPRAPTLLGLAAGGLVLADPGLPGNVSFRLSFGAVAGILLVAPRLLRFLPPDLPRVARWGASSLAATAGAVAGTLPDAAWTFQALSPVSPVANLVALPLLGGVAVPCALAAVALPGGLGALAAAVGDAACGLGLGLLVSLDLPGWAPAVGLVGAGLLGVAVLLARRPLAAALLVGVAIGLRPVPVGRLAVTFLPVGQGDAALVRLPDGAHWLVDGGPPGARTLAWLRRRGIRRLDTVVLSHPHPDHMAGLVPVLEALPVRRVWVPRAPEPGEAAYLRFWHAAWASGARVGVPLPVADARVEVLHPAPGWRATGRRRVNDESLVLRITHGRRSVLLTGDVEHEGEAALVAGGLGPADVVKAPHHGSRSSSGVALVGAVDAEWVVVSCGTANRHGHPHAAALGRWWGSRVARTDRDGAIRFTTDGRDLRVSRWSDLRGWTPLRRSRWLPMSPGRRAAGRSLVVRNLTLP